MIVYLLTTLWVLTHSNGSCSLVHFFSSMLTPRAPSLEITPLFVAQRSTLVGGCIFSLFFDCSPYLVAYLVERSTFAHAPRLLSSPMTILVGSSLIEEFPTLSRGIF